MGGDAYRAQDAIIMIHAALASRRYLMPTANILSKSMKVYVPEMPGHGASSKPIHALSVEEQAEVLFQWFELNGFSKAHIFANSYGCQIAEQLIVKHPEIVNSLILTGPTTDPTARTLVQQAYRLYMDEYKPKHPSIHEPTKKTEKISTDDEFSEWMSYYYLFPNPNLITKAIFYAEQKGILDKQELELH